MPDSPAKLDLGLLDLRGVAMLARLLAAMVRPGDLLLLSGGIGAGKTAFARALIRALAGDDTLEVPSPAFALHQRYLTPRLPVSHVDFYRLESPREAQELGLDELKAADLIIAEWPERGGLAAAGDAAELAFLETADETVRQVLAVAHGRFARGLPRLPAMMRLLRLSGWGEAMVEPFPGDASVRIYYRLRAGHGTALLMDWPRQPDGPPIRHGKPYSQIAHLAEGVAPFVAIAAALREAGLATPRLLAGDLEAGLLLIEDFGDAVFASLAAKGEDMRPLYAVAIDALIALRRAEPPAHIRADGAEHCLPPYDGEALAIETELLLDWYLPFATGAAPPPEARASFMQAWREQFDWLLGLAERAWVLRDFHSPNLIWRGGETGLARLGVIDFQDALIGHSAYDLVSLLKDARIDLPAGLEAALFEDYCRKAAALDARFDRACFERAYALLGAQRNTKILGIFARLAMRDGKRAYLAHLPRVARHLARALEHPSLAALKSWYGEHVPGLIEGPAQTVAEEAAS